jgi:hypothetical protein
VNDEAARKAAEEAASVEAAQKAAQEAAAAEAARKAAEEAAAAAQRTPEQVCTDVLVRSLKEALRNQLNIDIADELMDTQARKRKMKNVYQRILHPDKWMGWSQMEKVMNEVEKELNSKRIRYEVGNPI